MLLETADHGRKRRPGKGARPVTPMPTPTRKPASGPTDAKRLARRDRIVKSVLHSIFCGELVGGDRLVEEELAAKLGVSRTPIREALRELTAVGVIWLKPNHGAMVRPFGATQLLEIYQLRRLLEAEAARLACKSIDHNKLRQLRDEMQGLIQRTERTVAWSERALSLDQQLHELIARSSGSERLAEEIHRYWTLARTIGEAVRNVSQTQDHAVREHTAIIDSLLARDAEGASRAMAQHIERRAEVALQALCPPSGRGALRELLNSQTAAGKLPVHLT